MHIIHTQGFWFLIYFANMSEQRKEKATEKVFQQRIKDMTERIKNAPEARYVNGYGEATKREITSSTYKRAQKRQEKQIANMFRNR